MSFLDYSPITWADGPGGGTPLSAANLNNRETGLGALCRLVGSKPHNFWGLHLRSHPDADQEADKLWLDNLSGCVMQDGETVTGWPRGELLDHTATGVGGLDTQTGKAEGWYEVWAIRKKGDGTKGLIGTKATTYSQEAIHFIAMTAAGSQNIGSVEGAAEKAAQSFLTGAGGSVRWVDLALTRFNNPTDGLKLTIQTDAGGEPSGTVVDGREAFQDSTNLPSNFFGSLATFAIESGGPVRFRFDFPPVLAASTTYWLVLERTGAFDAGNAASWRYIGGYADGVLLRFDGTNWNPVGADGGFIVWTETPSNLTLPIGFDQQSLLGYWYLNEFNEWMRGVQYENRYRETETHRDLGFASSQRRTLMFLLAAGGHQATYNNATNIIPPTPCRAHLYWVNGDIQRDTIQVGLGSHTHGLIDGGGSNEVGGLLFDFSAETGSTKVNEFGLGWVSADLPVFHASFDATTGSSKFEIRADVIEWLTPV